MTGVQYAIAIRRGSDLDAGDDRPVMVDADGGEWVISLGPDLLGYDAPAGDDTPLAGAGAGDVLVAYATGADAFAAMGLTLQARGEDAL